MRSRIRRRSVSSWISPGPPGADAAAQSAEFGSATTKSGQSVPQLCELDLDHAFVAGGVLSENVQNQRDPVDDIALEDLLEVALLGRG
jgi:hypothetical protein